jgi:hypothetical protein
VGDALLGAVEHSGHGVGREGAGKERSLSVVAAERLQFGELLARLDSLGDRQQLEGMAQLDDGVRHSGVFPPDQEAGDEEAVDLDDFDGEPSEVGERRIARA